MAALLPVFIDLRGKSILLIGGRASMREKLLKLLPTGAALQVVARHFDPETLDLLRAHSVPWQERPFVPGDLRGHSLVIAAVVEDVDYGPIAAAARARGVLLNTVDIKGACDFYFAAQIERGPLQIAISTSGLFPGVARAIRLWLEDFFPQEVTSELVALGMLRAQAHRRLPDPLARTRALRQQLHLWLTEELSSQSGESA